MQSIAPLSSVAPINMPAKNAPTLQLNDIHLPTEINDYPVAIGWWLLAFIILIAIFGLIKKTLKNRRVNKEKKLALLQLSNNFDMTCSDTISLLKWVAIQYFERNEIAKLYGENFQFFLLEKLPLKHQQKFTELTTLGFSTQYKKENVNSIDNNFNLGAAHWITNALPTKNKSKVENKVEKKVKRKTNND